jgi:hypothetical protein
MMIMLGCFHADKSAQKGTCCSRLVDVMIGGGASSGGACHPLTNQIPHALTQQNHPFPQLFNPPSGRPGS